MAYVVVRDTERVLSHVSEVQRTADDHRPALGFFAATVYLEQASKGCIWVVEDSENSNLAGYLMFGGKFPRLSVIQLFVKDEYRHRGIGELLVKDLIDFGQQKQFLYIKARVAAELPANQFWKKMGFSVRSQETEKGKRTINIRARELEGTSLFSFSNAPKLDPKRPEPLFTNSIYILDLNIYFDVIKERTFSEDAGKIFSLAISNRIRLAVSPEFKVELERNKALIGNDPVLKLARALPTLTKINVRQELLEDLRQLIFPDRSLNRRGAEQDASDLRHLACAISYCTGFITRETAILRNSEALMQRYDIEIVAPSDLIELYGSTALKNDYPNVASGNVSFEFRPYSASLKPQITKLLEKLDLSCKDKELALEPQDSTQSSNNVVALVNGIVVGYVVCRRTRAIHELEAGLYVDESAPEAESIVDHFIQLIEPVPTENFQPISLHLAEGQELAYETALARGFLRRVPSANQSLLYRWFYGGVVLASDWHRFVELTDGSMGYRLPDKLPPHQELLHTGLFLKGNSGNDPTISLRDFESMTGAMLATRDRSFVIVPIRLGYAQELLGDVVPQRPLFLSKEATLRLERAYFLGSGKDKLVQPDSLVLFYVSGSSGGGKEIIGCGRVTFSTTTKWEAAYLSLRRQGVLDPEELESRSNRQDNIAVFTFDNFFRFRTPVSLCDLRHLNAVSGANLVTAQKIETSQFQEIVKLGMREDS